jgi:ACS family D-galactonate transporter-like MFS transporter
MKDSSASPAGSRLSAASWRVLVLLGFSVFINFVDRGNLSVAAPLLKTELGLSTAQLGILLSSSLWALMLCQIPIGWLIDRFNVNWILGLGFLLWSAATSITGLVHTFAALLAIRVLLGVAESVAYPAYGKIIGRNFPEHHRGIANAFIAVGQSCGTAFAAFAGGIVISHFGWRPFFVLLGVVGFPWILGWLRWAPVDKPLPQHETGPLSGVATGVLMQTSAWGTGLGLACGNYILYLLITWLPFYLVRERHFSLALAGEIGGVVFVLKATSALVSGRLSDRWISSGASPTLVRKTLLCVALATGGSLLVPCALVSARMCVVFLFGASTFLGLGTPHHYAASQSLAGTRALGSWTSLQMFVGYVGSVLAPLVTGIVVQHMGGFIWAFVIAAGVGWAGAFCWLFMVGTIQPVVWAPVQPEPLTAET